MIRLNLHWGGPLGVATRRPFNPTDPNDSAYNWAPYDRVVQLARAYHLQVLLSIIDTPALGERRRRAEPRAEEHVRPAQLCARRRHALQRDVDPTTGGRGSRP